MQNPIVLCSFPQACSSQMKCSNCCFFFFLFTMSWMMVYELSETGAMCQLTDISLVHSCSFAYKTGTYSKDTSDYTSVVSSFLIRGNTVVMCSVWVCCELFGSLHFRDVEMLLNSWLKHWQSTGCVERRCRIFVVLVVGGLESSDIYTYF